MEFPLQVTQAIVIRDAAGHLLITIGPGPDMWVYGEVTAMHITPTSVDTAGGISNPAGIEFYTSVNYIPNMSIPPSVITGFNQGGEPANSLKVGSGAGTPVPNLDRSFVLLQPHAFSMVLQTSTPNEAVIAIDKAGLDLGLGIEVVPYFKTSGRWTLLTLQNGWQNKFGGFAPCEFTMMADGYIGFRGNMVNGTKTDGTVLFNIPVGFRSQFPKQMVVRTDSNNPSFLNIRVDNGNVEIYNMPTGNEICLDGLHFPALVDFI